MKQTDIEKVTGISQGNISRSLNKICSLKPFVKIA